MELCSSFSGVPFSSVFLLFFVFLFSWGFPWFEHFFLMRIPAIFYGTATLLHYFGGFPSNDLLHLLCEPFVVSRRFLNPALYKAAVESPESFQAVLPKTYDVSGTPLEDVVGKSYQVLGTMLRKNVLPVIV